MLNYCTYYLFCTRTIKTEFTISIYLYNTNNNVVYSIFVFVCFGICILLRLLCFIVGFPVPDVVELASSNTTILSRTLRVVPPQYRPPSSSSSYIVVRTHSFDTTLRRVHWWWRRVQTGLSLRLLLLVLLESSYFFYCCCYCCSVSRC